MKQINSKYKYIIKQAIAEDRVNEDITTSILISPDVNGTATFTAKSKGIIAGTGVAKDVFITIDSNLEVDIYSEDGTAIKPGDVIAKVKGKIANILIAERVVLNFLQHLSGIATETARYVEAVKDLPVKITDTRKTLPGLRILEKQAVLAGGGKNHRMDLSDGILIKDNHIATLYSQGLNIRQIIAKVRHSNNFNLPIEIEVKNLEEAVEASEAEVDIIMLDNMNLDDLRQAVRLINGRSTTEASGGVNLNTVRAIAETGVDYISIGAITHSAKALDISLNLD
jgi:nicotinate-nucleotide pyrophosphorylase (carboxylating)